VRPEGSSANGWHALVNDQICNLNFSRTFSIQMPSTVIFILLLNELHEMLGKFRRHGRSSRLQTRQAGIYPQTHWTDHTMEALEWSTALEIGHTEIDDDHRAMVGLLNRLQEASRRSDRVATRAELADAGNPDQGSLRPRRASDAGPPLRIHGPASEGTCTPVRRGPRPDRRNERGHRQGAAAIAGFIKRWLIDHVETSDRQLAAALARRCQRSFEQPFVPDGPPVGTHSMTWLADGKAATPFLLQIGVLLIVAGMAAVGLELAKSGRPSKSSCSRARARIFATSS
jgi:hypothetical protein